MGDEEKLKIIIEAQNKAQAAFAEAQKQIDDTGQKFSSMSDKMESAGQKMKTVGKKMSLYVTVPLVLLGKSMFSAAADFEQLQIAMETMLGSADKAKKLLSELDKLAVKTPFQITEVQDAARQMLAYGIEADKVVETTRMLGDVSSGLGTKTFPQLTLAYGQIKAKGKLMGQELLQLTNAGFNLAEAMGVTRGELMQMMETGDGVTFEQVEQAFKNATGEGGRFHNMMQNQSKTTSGQLSNMMDKFTLLKRQLGKQLLPIAIEVISVFKTVATWFSKLSKGQQKLIVYVAIFLAVLGPLLTVLGNLMMAMSLILSPIGLIIAAIALLVAGLVYAYFKFEAFRNIVDTVFRAIVTVVKWAWENVIKPAWDAIVWYITTILIPYYKILWSVIQVVWNAIVAVIKWAWENVIKPIWDLIYWYVTTVLIPVWTKIWEVAVWVWNKVVEGIQAAWGFIKPIWDTIWAFITDKLVPAFQKIWDKVSDVFTKVWNTIGGWVTNVKDGFDKVKGWIQNLVEKFNDIKDKVGEAFGNVADAITKPFKSAFNTVIDLWNKSIGKISIDLPDWLGGKKFSMPKLDKLYKGTRNWGGGPAIVGDVNGRGGEIVNLPGGTDVFSNRESKQILRNLAAGQSGGATVTFTGNIILGDASAVKEFFKKLDRDADKASMGVPV